MLVKEEEFKHVEVLAASVDFGLAYLPYAIRCIRDDENSFHDTFGSADMKVI